MLETTSLTPRARIRTRVRRDAKDASRVAVVVVTPTEDEGANQLLVHEGERRALTRALETYSGRHVVLSITDNQTSMVTHELKDGVLHARVHHMFLGAPASIQNALVRYIVDTDADAGWKVDLYIEQNTKTLNKRQVLRHDGRVHNLTAIYNEVNARYFEGRLSLKITWGRAYRARGPRKSMRLGSFNYHSGVIRVNPALDRKWVPRYVIALVVYHEMLHYEFAPKKGEKRRCLHSSAFQEREAQFKRYKQALAWEQKNLPRLLRS